MAEPFLLRIAERRGRRRDTRGLRTQYWVRSTQSLISCPLSLLSRPSPFAPFSSLFAPRSARTSSAVAVLGRLPRQGGRERCELSGFRQQPDTSAAAREAFGQPVGCRLRSSVYPGGVEQRNWQWATARHRAVASIYSMLLQQSRQSSLTTWELKSLFKKRKGPKQTYATRLVFQGYFT